VKFKPGDLAILIDTCGNILSDVSPVLILRCGYGRPLTGGMEEYHHPEEIYEILFGGFIDRGVAGEWLINIYDYPEIS